jgi:hypothetical protein
MIERFESLEHMAEWPEEVRHEIMEYEGMDRELVIVEHTSRENESDSWEIVYYEPLIKGEESPFDIFWFAYIRWSNWPTSAEWVLTKHFYSMDRTMLRTLHNFKGKIEKKEEVA